LVNLRQGESLVDLSTRLNRRIDRAGSSIPFRSTSRRVAFGIRFRLCGMWR